MRSILVVSAALLAGACVPQPTPRDFVVVRAFNESDASRGAQPAADRYCGRFGRLALAANRQVNYIGFQCVEPANSLVAQTPLPPVWD